MPPSTERLKDLQLRVLIPEALRARTLNLAVSACIGHDSDPMGCAGSAAARYEAQKGERVSGGVSALKRPSDTKRRSPTDAVLPGFKL